MAGALEVFGLDGGVAVDFAEIEGHESGLVGAGDADGGGGGGFFGHAEPTFDGVCAALEGAVGGECLCFFKFGLRKGHGHAVVDAFLEARAACGCAGDCGGTEDADAEGGGGDFDECRAPLF